MQDTNPNLKQLDFLFSKISEGFAYCKMILDEKGEPADWVYLDVNEAYERINGVKKSDVVGKRATEVLPTIRRDPADWISLYGKVALTGEPIVTERYAEVRKKWYHISAYSPQKGYFVSIFEDITERKKVEEEIKRAKEDWERTFEAVPDLIAIVDTNYKIVRANQAMTKQLGVAPQEAVGLICYKCVHGATAPPNNCPHAQLLKDGQQHTAEVNEPHLGGDFIVSTTPLIDDKGKIFGSVHVARNITARKRAEEALKKLNETLEERIRERTQTAVNERKRLYQVLETLPAYVVLLDKNYHVPFANKVFRELFGESKGRPCYEFLFKRDSPCENCETFKVLKTNKTLHWEWTGPNGHDYDIYDFPFLDEDGSTLILEMGLDITDRKLAEAELKRYQGNLEKIVAERTSALRESEERWATTLSSIGDAVIATDTEEKITFMNAEAEELTGWTFNEAKQKPVKQIFNIINEQTRKEVESPVKKVLEKGFVVGLANHTLLICKDGKEVPIDDSGAPIVAEGGEVRGVVLVFRDISERKKAEDALRESEERLKRSQAIAHLGSWELDIKENKLFWSDEVYIIFGLKPQEFGATYDAFLASVHPDDRAAVNAAYSNSVREGKEGYEIEHRVVRKDTGEIRFVHEKCTHIHDTYGKVIKSIGMVHDITERKKAEKEIARLASFPALNPNPVVEVDINGKITYLNPATKRLFPSLEADGLNHIFFFDWANVKATFEDRSTDAFGREVKIDDHWYHQQFYLVPQTKQIRIYSIDIDELKQTEQAREKAQIKLEENAVTLEEYASQMEELAEQRAQQLQNSERLAAIGQTAGMVGHDIRNPLQAITSDMYLISEEVKSLKDDENKRAILESVDSVNQNISYINKIVSDLQDYTRPLKPNLQEVNLSELIEGTLLTVNVPKEIAVTIEVDAAAKPIKTDVAYLRRILTNLFTNAVQAMPNEGKLTITASRNKDTVALTVEDTGVGIPEEVKAKMFTPLFTTKSKGQGLGLAVVKRLVDALCGSIRFESRDNEGTKFTVELPQTK